MCNETFNMQQHSSQNGIIYMLILTNIARPIRTVNPIALRKAKIVYNFGLSECNRFKIVGQPGSSTVELLMPLE